MANDLIVRSMMLASSTSITTLYNVGQQRPTVKVSRSGVRVGSRVAGTHFMHTPAPHILRMHLLIVVYTVITI
jgi:hypothetical protein